MWSIQELSNATSSQIKELAELHRRAFPAFFLTQLGLPFLFTLYKGYMDDAESGIIVAEEKGKFIGFIAYSRDYPEFYKGLIKKKIVQFVWCSFLAFLRNPSFAKRLFGAFKKSDSVQKAEKYVELASICVNPRMNNRGLGTELINYLKAEVDYSQYAYINLETDADNNENANRFYEKNGFVLERQYRTAEGRNMNEYRYSPRMKYV